jgi:hypothetical protein
VQQVYSAVAVALKSAGSPVPPLARVPAFGKAAEMLADFADRFKPRGEVERKQVLELLIRILARWMRRKGVPVTCKTMINCMPRVPALCENAFPGYLGAGLLPMVLRRRAGIR